MFRAFWDSSSLTPLCVVQGSTEVARALSSQYEQVVWWATPVEMSSSFARLVRLGQISSNSQAMALVTLDRLIEHWREIAPTDALRERAEIFVDRFGLTAGDALQLAAAWTWSAGHPRNRTFISGDTRLLDSARQLGFSPIAC